MALKIPIELLKIYQTARTLQFSLQARALPLITKLATGQSQPQQITIKQQLSLKQEVEKLINLDCENISKGLYPVDVLWPERPDKHIRRAIEIFRDGLQVSKRRVQKETQDFSAKEMSSMQELPDYYKRNFHFQTGGYLSEKSAELYDHQVDILFSGTTDAMRRLLLPLLKEKWPGNGEGLHFLEIAAGTGRLTRFVKLAYPQARITVTDLSWPYLAKAQENLRGLSRLDFVQAAAEKLPFTDNSFDAVLSCFLFHELPMPVRQKVLQESKRVLREAGVFAMADSVQKGDNDEFLWALERFPKDFHEPFYKNYSLHSLENLIDQAGFANLRSCVGFLTKALIAERRP